MREASEIPEPWSSNTADSGNEIPVWILGTFWYIFDSKDREVKRNKIQLEVGNKDRNQNVVFWKKAFFVEMHAISSNPTRTKKNKCFPWLKCTLLFEPYGWGETRSAFIWSLQWHVLNRWQKTTRNYKCSQSIFYGIRTATEHYFTCWVRNCIWRYAFS